MENKDRFEPPADAVVRVKIRIKIAGVFARRKYSVLENRCIGRSRLRERQNRRADEKVAPNVRLNGGVEG